MHYDFTTIYDRHGMDALAVDGVGSMPGFSPDAPKNGTTFLPMWVADMNFACDFITRHFPGVQVAKPAGTYMLFLDCTDWCAAHDKTPEDVLHAGWDVGVAWQDGRMFHGPCSIRMNLALPLSRVKEAFDRLDKHVFNGEWV